ncbi:MAG TPA: heparinase II/III family protein [Gemmatimonadales bacterium]
MVTAEQIAARRQAIAASADLRALEARVRERAAPVIARMPHVPEHKALLSVDGGFCPTDRATLVFDPWSPTVHRCPRCGASVEGQRHDRAWAKYQHLWLAERAAGLATLAALSDDRAAAGRASEILGHYGERYLRFPNRDNVLGPARLFFSTYLESIWICNYLAAAWLLREAGVLDDATAKAVHSVADEAANLIGEFDEGFSNRQTWNDAALTAIAVWFEDEDLARRAVESETGLAAHLRGYRRDGLWYEGENYHLFAVRGLMTGAGWAAHAGVDFFAEDDLGEALTRALLAPARSALPDFTFPARKDARFGVSLAQPMYLETWEVALGRMGKGEEGRGNAAPITSWLRALYQAPDQPQQLFESYLHDAVIEPLATPHARGSLSWWSLLEMAPALPDAEPWAPASVLLEDQGLAVLRQEDRYASLECGPVGGGHGHPDRLHLTVHANGVHWLPDSGTGSYVTPDLFWYRSTLAHNAPRLDGASQPFTDAHCAAFQALERWAWARGRWDDCERTLVAGPDYLLDIVLLDARESHRLELPWHGEGSAEIETAGRWEPAELSDEQVTGAERFVPGGKGPLVVTWTSGERRLRAHLAFDGQLLRAEGPGLPTRGGRASFLLLRADGRSPRLVTVLDAGADAPAVKAIRSVGDVVEIETAAGTDRHRPHVEGWSVESGKARIVLRGIRAPEPARAPFLDLEPIRPAAGVALRVGDPPALDGSLAGFDVSDPLRLELEDQYRRSEEAYSGADDFSAVAYANWDGAALYLAVEVTKPDFIVRPGGAAPLLLDNDPDDVHSDGVQVYLRMPESDTSAGYLVVPDGVAGGGVRVSAASGTAAGASELRGGWQRTPTGYRVTIAVAPQDWPRAHVGAQIGFDLIVNEMVPGRVRRAGPLVWSGGGGWVWIRGDRHEPERFGTLELSG